MKIENLQSLMRALQQQMGFDDLVSCRRERLKVCGPDPQSP
jgi:hypothetical protein